MSAFCLVFFGANGGSFTPTGLPIIQEGVRGHCPEPFDCGQCSLLQGWIAERVRPNWNVSWECWECLDGKEQGRLLPGYYQSGFCQRCQQERILLQLVLRRP